MQIIIGKENAQLIEEKYTVLELDQFKIEPAGPVLTAYCVVGPDDIPLGDINVLDNHKNLHQKLVENFRKKNWDFCEQALEHLHGRWGGTVNSFYDEISQRIAKYKEQDPGPDWNGVYEKYNSNN